MKPPALPHPVLFAATFAWLILSGGSARALITGGEGNEPVENRGWPTGSEQVANLKTRVAYWEGPPFGGGEYTFEYRAKSTKDLNRALAALAKIAAPRRELILSNGPAESFWLKIRAPDGDEEIARIDWTFVVWNAGSWHQLYNNPTGGFLADHPNFRKPLAPPRLHAYFGGGNIVWDEVTVPDGVTVIDRRGKPGDQASITGGVYDMDTRQALGGAKVTVGVGTAGPGSDLPVTTTDETGRFHLGGLPEGAYVAVVSYEGYATKRALAYETFRGADTREITVDLAKAATLSGEVRGPAGEGIAGARVIAKDVIGKDGFGYPAEGLVETKTDAEGRFVLEGLPEGFTRLLVWAEGWYYAGSVTTLHEVPGEAPLAINMIGTGTVKGTLKAGEGKQAAVAMHPPGGEKIGSWSGSMNCQPDGSFEFKNVPVGEYLVGPSRSATLKPGDPGVKAIEVIAGETVSVTLVEAD